MNILRIFHKPIIIYLYVWMDVHIMDACVHGNVSPNVNVANKSAEQFLNK